MFFLFVVKFMLQLPTYEGEKMSSKWIKIKQPAWIGLDYNWKHNPLIDWENTLDLQGDDDTIGYDFKIVLIERLRH